MASPRQLVALLVAVASFPAGRSLEETLQQFQAACLTLREADAHDLASVLPSRLSVASPGSTSIQDAFDLLSICRRLGVSKFQAATPTPAPSRSLEQSSSTAEDEETLRRIENFEGHVLTQPNVRYPLIFVAIFLVCFIPAIIFCEVCGVPKSTLLTGRVDKAIKKAESEFIHDVGHMKSVVAGATSHGMPHLVHSDTKRSRAGSGSQSTSPPISSESTEESGQMRRLSDPFAPDLAIRSWTGEDVRGFWRKVEDTESMFTGQDFENHKDEIGFTKSEFTALEGTGVVTIGIYRRGSLQGDAEVQFRTTEAEPSAFQATKNVDFVDCDERLQIKEGQNLTSVNVEIPETDFTWTPTRWFKVELSEPSGNVALGGPSTRADFSAAARGTVGTKVSARVYIIQNELWPADCKPEWHHQLSGLWLVYYYVKERIASRGMKYWRTLFALLYVPFHSIVVTTVVQKFMIDWATISNQDTGLVRIIVVALVQLISIFLLRLGDVVQRVDRGRTGGCRQEHRMQLLSKLLMMDYSDHFTVPDSRWFYTALVDVNVVVIDGYWQSFQLMENLYGLLLSVVYIVAAEIITAALSGERIRYDRFIPVGISLIILPLATLCISLRTSRSRELLDQRVDAEQAWVDTFAWLTQSGPKLYCLGPRELARVERRFAAESKLFVGRHQAARDMVEDSVWITKYMGYASYLIILVMAAFNLHSARVRGSDSFEAGDFVSIIRIYDKFGKYLTGVTKTMISLIRAGVSLRRMAQLLNLQENAQRFNRVGLENQGRQRASMHFSDHKGSRSSICFNYVDFEPPERRFGLGPMGPLNLRDYKLDLPLGKVILVSGDSESQEMSFLGIAAGIFRPSQGVRQCPDNIKIVMLPEVPLGSPHTTAKEALQLAGLSEQVANRLAQALGVDPDIDEMRLGVGQMKALNLARTLLRDPDVLVSARPLDLVHPDSQRNLAHLIRLWQLGLDSATIVAWLADIDPRHEAIADVHRHRSTKTLLITGEEFSKISGVQPDMKINITKLRTNLVGV
mmetsp:Transcript_115820/g.225425  ORF Transcript_115820/g.225425 Transcript_115820/m.225425 type:complete len:1026 (-) Transcript_115820:59-3136(-)